MNNRNAPEADNYPGPGSEVVRASGAEMETGRVDWLQLPVGQLSFGIQYAWLRKVLFVSQATIAS